MVAAAGMVLLTACGGGVENAADRLEEVRRAGERTMPFDLDKTQHSFYKTEDGGIQTVAVREDGDREQVELIRRHLREVASEFAAGNFQDPISIHGEEMPGVRELSAGVDRLQITYRDVSRGGEITYKTGDDVMVGHLHAWFEAQVAEHGIDATHGPTGHTMTEEMWRRHHPGQPYPDEESGD
jgi:hypothetical protein